MHAHLNTTYTGRDVCVMRMDTWNTQKENMEYTKGKPGKVKANCNRGKRDHREI